MNTELLTVAQTAEYLKVSDKTIRRLIKNGQLQASKIGNRSWRIRACDIENYVIAKSNKRNVNLEKKSEKLDNVNEESNLGINLFDPKTFKAPRLISLFSGCGGMDLGFKKAGFDIIWANDFDSDAQEIYSRNIGEIDKRDILSVKEDEIPNGDILTAGFPCQPFSNAGNRKGIHDSRGMLYKECLRIIEKKLPKVIVFENVKGLLSTKYIDGRNLAEVIVEDLSTMSGIGYDVQYQLVNASDYGVPQNRHRVLFIGVRKDLGITFKFPPKQSKEHLSLKYILDVPSDVENNVSWAFSPQALDMIKYIPEGGSWKDVPYEHLAPKMRYVALLLLLRSRRIVGLYILRKIGDIRLGKLLEFRHFQMILNF